MENEAITRHLEKIGLNDKSALIYSTLLTMGGAYPSALADATRINRSTVYKILLDLSIKGLVTEIERSKKLYYQILKQTILCKVITPICDVLAVGRNVLFTTIQDCMVDMARMVSVTITTYGLDSNVGCYHFVPASNPPIDRPYLKRSPTIPSTKRLAEALFVEADNPIDQSKEESNEDKSRVFETV